MEHKIVTGGEIYLPFARSRIKALRATGLEYASQQFEMGDASVKVRIAGEHEYINISGEGCNLLMDSGVVELSPLFGPLKFRSGKLLSTSKTQAYEGSFTRTTPKGRRNPGKTSAGQLAGAIKGGSRFVGLLPPGGVGSFSALRIPADPPTTPQTYVDSFGDGLALGKKFIAGVATPSLFTGKTRLYVQAMYGLPLYEYEADGHTLKKVNSPPGLNAEPGATPSVTVNSYVRKDDFSLNAEGVQQLRNYPDVPITTSSGVHLDAGGQHWLFDLSGFVVVVYPLISSPCGEKLRKYLTTGSKLSLEDRNHLEAYILAYSLPDGKYKQKAPDGPGDAGSFSMGYGWHWDWQGLNAVMTVNNRYQQDVGPSEEVARNFGMESTTYQIIMKQVPVTPGPSGFPKGAPRFQFEAKRSILDGPTKWSILRTYWCIVCPDWGGQLTKITPKFSASVYSRATFYSYYAGDELQMCSSEQILKPGQNPDRQFSPRYAQPEYGGTISHLTLGLLDGFCYDPPKGADHIEMNFRIGPYSISSLPVGKVLLSQRHDLTDKTVTGQADNPIFGCGNARVSSYDIGYPIGGLNALDPLVYPQTRSFMNIPCGGYPMEYTYQRAFESKREEYSSVAEIIIPVNDSQAVFVRHDKSMLTDKTNTTEQRTGVAYSGFWVYRSKLSDGITTSLQTVDRYDFAGLQGGQFFTTNDTTREIKVTAEEGVLVCGKQIIPATFTLTGQFHANELDVIQTTYTTFSNAKSDSVLSSHITPVGIGGTVPTLPAFVGWA